MQQLVDAISDYNHRTGRECKKVKYFSPAQAKKGLRDHGYAIGARQWYLCPHCEGEVYHLTKLKRFIRKP